MQLSILTFLILLSGVLSQQSDNEKFAAVITKYISENPLAYNRVESNLGGYGVGYINLHTGIRRIKLITGFKSKSIELKSAVLKNPTAGSKSREFTMKVVFKDGRFMADSTIDYNDTKHKGMVEMGFQTLVINFDGEWEESLISFRQWSSLDESSGYDYKWTDFDIDVTKTFKEASLPGKDYQKETADFVMVAMAKNTLKAIFKANIDKLFKQLQDAFK